MRAAKAPWLIWRRFPDLDLEVRFGTLWTSLFDSAGFGRFASRVGSVAPLAQISRISIWKSVLGPSGRRCWTRHGFVASDASRESFGTLWTSLFGPAQQGFVQ